MKKKTFLTMVMALMTAVAAFSCGKMDETETTEPETTFEENIITERILEENVITEAIVFKQIPTVTTVTEITVEPEITEITTSTTMYGINPEIEAQLAYHQALQKLKEEAGKTIDDSYAKEKEYNSQVNIYFGRK